MICKTCGDDMSGDGYSVPLHCIEADGWEEREPDAEPWHCRPAAHNAHVIKYWAWRRWVAQQLPRPLAETFFAQWHADELAAAGGSQCR